jgi:choline dehydrogenase-like flavoprotein
MQKTARGEDAMAGEQYDAIVIGTSQGGRFLPIELAKAGQEVALVERDQVGPSPLVDAQVRPFQGLINGHCSDE